MLNLFYVERWPSGLRRTLGKRVYSQGYRKFESCPFRQNKTKYNLLYFGLF